MASILIVDDERPIRRILTVLLQERRHRVAEAGSGEEALALLGDRSAEAKPDLVLLDLKLPGIDGLETLKRLRALEPRLDVVMMTAHGSISSAVEAMRRGAFDYLTKPFDNDELLMLVDRALEMRRLSAENEALREEIESRYGFSEIVGISREIQDVFRRWPRSCGSTSPC